MERVKRLFGNKIKGNPNNVLLEGNNDLIRDEKSLDETFNDYFVNVVSNLGINFVDDNSGKGDVSMLTIILTINLISNYNNHPSIITIKHFMSKFRCGFPQRFSTQYCLLVMAEKLREIRDEKGVFPLTCQKPSTVSDTVSDCILLIAELNEYGFDMKYQKPNTEKNWIHDLQRMFECGFGYPSRFL